MDKIIDPSKLIPTRDEEFLGYPFRAYWDNIAIWTDSDEIPFWGRVQV